MKIGISIVLIAVTSMLVGVNSVSAAETVGRESWTVNWELPAGSSQAQLYFGQTNTGNMDSTIPGLTASSRSVTLNLLKACTQYSWNVNYLRDGRWYWLGEQTFVSGGACSASDAAGSLTTTSSGASAMISGVASGTAMWSPVDGATRYNVYYRESGNTSWPHSVSVGANSTSVTINHLNPSVSYYYKVAALLNGREVWQSEKMLQSAVPASPVLGIFDDLFGKKSLYDNYDDQPAPSMPITDDESYKEMNGIGGDEMYQEDDIYETEELEIMPVSDSDQESLMYEEEASLMYGEDDEESLPVSEFVTEVLRRNNWGNATWSNPGQTVSKYHVYYWSADNDRHAVRDLSSQAQTITINALNTSRAYSYQVEAILTNGQSVWVTGVLPLN